PTFDRARRARPVGRGERSVGGGGGEVAERPAEMPLPCVWPRVRGGSASCCPLFGPGWRLSRSGRRAPTLVSGIRRRAGPASATGRKRRNRVRRDARRSGFETDQQAGRLGAWAFDREERR